MRRLEKFTGGQSDPTYLVEGDLGRYVLRRKPPGRLLKGAHAVDREYRVLLALAETDVPVPRVEALCTDETVLGSVFYVMEHVTGRVFFDARLPGLSGDERGAIYDAMNAALARLHALDPAAIGLADFGRPGNYFARQLARWVENYRASEIEARPELDAAIAWLEANLPRDDGAAALVHGDFRHDNMIFAADRPRLLALIDWELSTLGHPLADLAYQVAQ